MLKLLKHFLTKISLQYSQAIASISKSISSVVLRSPCEQFRRKCSQLLEVTSLNTVLTGKIMSSHYIDANIDSINKIKLI